MDLNRKEKDTRKDVNRTGAGVNMKMSERPTNKNMFDDDLSRVNT